MKSEIDNLALARRIRAGDAEARAEMIEANMGLVSYFSRRFVSKKSADYEDFLEYGYIGLIEAVDRYDPEFGNGFGTFAKHHIDRYFRIARWERSSVVGVPYYIANAKDGLFGDHLMASARVALNRTASIEGLDLQSRDRDPSEEFADVDLVHKVREVVGRLPSREREVVTMIDLVDYPPTKRKVAERVGCHCSYVHTILDRAYSRLRVLAKGLVEVI